MFVFAAKVDPRCPVYPEFKKFMEEQKVAVIPKEVRTDSERMTFFVFRFNSLG